MSPLSIRVGMIHQDEARQLGCSVEKKINIYLQAYYSVRLNFHEDLR